MNVFLKLGWFFKERKKEYTIGILVLLCVSILQIIPPKIIGIMLDEIGAGTLTIQSLLKWLGIIGAIAVVMYMLRYYWRKMIFGSSNYLAKVLRQK